MMEDNNIKNKKPIQLEFTFSSEENSISSNSKHSLCNVKKTNFAKIIKINEGMTEINRKREAEILNYILSNSKRF